MNKKLMLAVPTNPNGAVDAHLVEWLLSTKLDGWDIEVRMERNAPVSQARNALVKKFLKSDCDVLFTIDSDQIPQSSADTTGGIALLIEAIERDDVDVVNAITVRNSDDGPVMVLNKLREDYRAEIYTEILAKPVGLHELGDRGVIGGAAIMVKRHVLEKFMDEGTPWFKDVYVDKPNTEFSVEDGRDLFGERMIGHDYWFFLRCHDFGFRSWVDTRAFWGHVKAVDMRKGYLRELDLLKKAAAPTLENVPPVVAGLARTLSSNWGNTEWAAPPQLVARVASAASRVSEDECVVECGSGLTTTVLRNVVGSDRVLSLEEDKEWAGTMGLESSELKSYGDYDWYDGPKPKMPVSLIVCDGPRGSTRGGRYGALPQMYEYLAPKFTVILDDVHRPEEKAIMDRWVKEYGLKAKIMRGDNDRAFAVLEGSK